MAVWLEVFFRIAELIGLAFTVWALRLARVQYRDSKDQEKRLKVIADDSKQVQERLTSIADDSRRVQGRLTAIAESISTQFIGTFPGNMKELTSMVSRTQHDLWILADVVAYGFFSNPQGFDEYFQALLVLARKSRDVKIYVLNDHASRLNTEAQFKLPHEFPKLEASDSFQQYFRKVPSSGVQPKSPDQFVDLIEQHQKDYRRVLENSGISCQATLASLRDLPLLLWIRDHEEVVFSFYSLGDEVREMSFRSVDGNLVRAFEDIFREATAPRPLAQATSARL